MFLVGFATHEIDREPNVERIIDSHNRFQGEVRVVSRISDDVIAAHAQTYTNHRFVGL